MRTVVCIIGMWMWVWVLHAQTGYYSETKTLYRQIEIELKKNIWFIPTSFGKSLNYIYMFWTQDPNVTLNSKQ